jgi:hypothetical protein
MQPRVVVERTQTTGPAPGPSNARRRRATDEPANQPPRRITRSSSRQFISLDEDSEDDFIH